MLFRSGSLTIVVVTRVRVVATGRRVVIGSSADGVGKRDTVSNAKDDPEESVEEVKGNRQDAKNAGSWVGALDVSETTEPNADEEPSHNEDDSRHHEVLVMVLRGNSDHSSGRSGRSNVWLTLGRVALRRISTLLRRVSLRGISTLLRRVARRNTLLRGSSVVSGRLVVGHLGGLK